MRKRIQLRDIADAVGVSATSVSLALRDDPRISEPTRQRVQRAARRMGYVNARRRPSIDELWRLGFVYCDPNVTTFEAVEPMLRLIMRDAMPLQVRFEMLLVDGALSPANARQTVADFSSQLQGLLLFGRVHTPILELLSQINVPAVIIGECDVPHDRAAALKMQRVTDDPTRAGILATEYLLARGRRRIAFAAGLHEPGFYYELWHRGFVYAHASAGVAIDPRRVLWHERGTHLNDRIGQLLESTEPPDALVCPDWGYPDLILPYFREHGVKIAGADVVVGGMLHLPPPAGAVAVPQILSDLTHMTNESIRRLKTICKMPAESATTITIAHVMRQFSSTNK